MYSVTPSHITQTNISEVGLDQAAYGQPMSNENRALPDGFHGDPNSGNHVVYVAGRMIRTVYDWLTSADAALRFPAAGAAPVPLFQTHGNIMRTFEMPHQLELHPEVMQLKVPDRKPDLSSKFHQGIATKLKATLDAMFKISPVVEGSRIAMVSDLHETGRSLLTLRHLMLMASRGELMVLLDGLPRGKEGKRVQEVFKEDLPVGLLRGLENDLSATLTQLIYTHPIFFDMQSKSISASDPDKRIISHLFNQMLTRIGDSEACQKAYSDFMNFAPQEEKAPILPFIRAMQSHVPGSSVGDYLAEWYVNGSVEDRKSVTLFLGRMMSDLGKSSDKKAARQIKRYLEDPKNRKNQTIEAVALLRRQAWQDGIEAACQENEVKYKKTGRKADIVIFGGKLHEDEITGLLRKSAENAEESKAEMKSEL